jgi:hypothetical protein
MRIWDNRGDDDGSIHVMGNGEMVACGQGPDLANLYGPPYTSPNILTLSTVYDDHLVDEAVREPHTAIWQHRLRRAGEAGEVASFCEYMAVDSPVYIRSFMCRAPGVRWVIRPNGAAQVLPAHGLPEVWLLVQPPGQRILFYLSTRWFYHWIIPTGSCHLERDEGGELVAHCLPGMGGLAIVGASEYPLGVLIAERVARQGLEDHLPPTRRFWDDLYRRRTWQMGELPAADENDKQALDSAAVLLKVFQSIDGGMMVGHHFQLSYLRDSYGAARGLLSLGLLEEARQVLGFRLRKFGHWGTLQTAEGMGTDAFRHVHENDEVEGPAYTILQVRDYVQAGGEREFARACWPMLDWCWRVQLGHLVGGLLPFNGDETYVAGGFYPRSGLAQGSADCTLAFIEAGRWLAPWAEAQGFWTHDEAAQHLTLVEEARAAYRQAFLAGDHLWVNEPQREALAPLPRFRHGVCEGCFARAALAGGFGWLERSTNGRYLCPTCLVERADLPPDHPAPLEIHSVSLLPAYLNSDILNQRELRLVAERVLRCALPDGQIPSVPGTKGFVGYDPALILINLVTVGHAAAAQARERLMFQRDRAGVWDEYYSAEGVARAGCCRARTWETGISAEALVRYVISMR